MVRMFIRHSVNDYGAWREGYDAFEEHRPGFKVKGHGVYQLVGNPNDVTVFHDFETAEDAETLASSRELREAMEGAGVQGQPDIWLVEES